MVNQGSRPFAGLIIRGALIACVGLAVLAFGAVIVAQTPSAAHCLTVQDISSGSNVITTLLDTTRGRAFQMPETEGISVGRVSPDQQYYAVTRLENDVLNLALFPVLEDGRTGDPVPIRSGVGSASSFYAPPRFLWSPDSRSLIYLWHDDATGVSYVSLYDVRTQTDSAYPLTRRDGDPSRSSDFSLLGWSNAMFGVNESWNGKPYYRFFSTDPLLPVSTALDDVPLYDPVWSPAGSQLAALTLDPDGVDLILSDLTTPSAPIPLSMNYRDIRKLFWSPDGAYVVVTSIVVDQARRAERWRYDLYHRDGSPAALDLYGLQITSLDLLPSVLPALWHGDHWVWVEQSGDQPALVTLNLSTGERTTLARNLVPERSVDMFYISSSVWLYQLPSATPLYLSSSPRLVVPTRAEDGRIAVDLLDLETGGSTPIVSGAESLEAVTLSNFSDLWSDDGRTVTVVWSTGHASTRRTYFTVHDLPTGTTHSTGGDSDQITAVSRLDETRYGYISQTNSDYTFHLFDRVTGAQQEITPLPAYAASWQGAPSPDQTRLALFASTARGTGGLGTVILRAEQTSTLLSDHAISAPYWSPDGAQIAFLEYDLRAAQHATVATFSADGERSGEFSPFLPHYNPSLWLGGWSDCAVIQ